MTITSAMDGLDTAATRYRVVAWLTGTFLVILCCVGVPLQYADGQSAVVSIVGPVHGVLFIVYLLVAYDVIRRVRWPMWPSLAIFAAGTVPFLTFVAERYVTTRVRRMQARRIESTATPGASAA